MTDREMMRALEADGEKLRQLTGEDHGPWSITAESPLLPCPFCGMQMTLQGDYTHETAWNFYCHADIDESSCLLKDHRIDTQRDMRTPDYNEAIAWNRRVLSGKETYANYESRFINALTDFAIEETRYRTALETIKRTTFSGSEMGEEYMRGNQDAHATCAKMAGAALTGPAPIPQNRHGNSQ